MNKPEKSRNRSRGVAAMMESAAELRRFADKGLTIEDIKRAIIGAIILPAYKPSASPAPGDTPQRR